MDVSKERLHNNYDVLRIAAAVCITFTHSFNLLKQNDAEPLMRLSGGRYDCSFIGLCVFFSISGYLITKSAVNSASFVQYVWKRFLRIQPLLIIVCVLTVFVLGPLVTTLTLSGYFNDTATWTYFRNVFPATGIQFTLPGVFENNIAERGVNGSLWTLVIEERLYLFVSILFLLKNDRRKYFLYLLLLFNMLYVLHSTVFSHRLLGYLEGGQVFYGLVFLNAGACYLLKINFKGIAGKRFVLLLLIFSVAVIMVPALKFLQVYLIPLLVITLANIRGLMNRAGQWGDFTYGIYIFSFPVQQLLVHVGASNESPYRLFFLAMLIVLPLAVLSWHFIEKNFLRLKAKVH